MGVVNQLGSLANVYTVLEETEDLVALKIRCTTYGLQEMQALYDKGFKIIDISHNKTTLRLLLEKPEDTHI